MPKESIDLKAPLEKVLLVILDIREKQKQWDIKNVQKEMEELVIACAGVIVDSMVVKVSKPTASYLITESKVNEIVNLLTIKNVDTVIFSHDLKGSQQRNLEEKLHVKTIDRTQLILDIFVRHATTQEGKMQVELAQLQYLLPRLVGKGIELSQLGGGIGTLGPGETKLEVDRRRIDQRITRLRRNLDEVVSHRALTRKKRKEKGVPTVSLVGYTNAGKSTLLNILTDAGQKTKDGLFTTLDSLSRQMLLPNHQKVIISDTVGFMHDLPHHLIEAFRATLEEVKEADLLLHVLDVSDPNFRDLHEAVQTVLKELDSLDRPTITVLNKLDKLDKNTKWAEFENLFENSVCISAMNKVNIDKLLAKISEMVGGFFVEINADIPINRMDLVNLAHDEGQVYSVKYYNEKINIRASVPSHIAGKFQ
ncbi:MAG TPA: GTPase HflX [Candidatus Omnitrophota bacterium]|nr:GTPase HflX [Candidatus Omnitrophota bacterium]